jgi:hypothetical protein
MVSDRPEVNGAASEGGAVWVYFAGGDSEFSVAAEVVFGGGDGSASGDRGGVRSGWLCDQD